MKRNQERESRANIDLSSEVALNPFPSGSDGKNLPAVHRPGFEPWIGKIPWRREWQPTAVFLSGESHGQRSLAGHGPWGHQESED